MESELQSLSKTSISKYIVNLQYISMLCVTGNCGFFFRNSKLTLQLVDALRKFNFPNFFSNFDKFRGHDWLSKMRWNCQLNIYTAKVNFFSTKHSDDTYNIVSKFHIEMKQLKNTSPIFLPIIASRNSNTLFPVLIEQ